MTLNEIFTYKGNSHISTVPKRSTPDRSCTDGHGNPASCFILPPFPPVPVELRPVSPEVWRATNEAIYHQPDPAADRINAELERDRQIGERIAREAAHAREQQRLEREKIYSEITDTTLKRLTNTMFKAAEAELITSQNFTDEPRVQVNLPEIISGGRNEAATLYLPQSSVNSAVASLKNLPQFKELPPAKQADLLRYIDTLIQKPSQNS